MYNLVFTNCIFINTCLFVCIGGFMDSIAYYFDLSKRINSLYVDAINGKQNVLLELKDVYDEMIDNGIVLDELCEDDKKVVLEIINLCNSQIKLINYLLKRKKDTYSLDVLRKDFVELENEHFTIINSYIMGIVKIADVNAFNEHLEAFREKLYNIPINYNILIEIAKMKSKIQHFYTEILEDEELLDMAYKNAI